jgi:hypothetical protein
VSHHTAALRRRAALEAVWGPSTAHDGDIGGASAAWRWIARDNPAAAFPTDFALVRRAGVAWRARPLQALT